MCPCLCPLGVQHSCCWDVILCGMASPKPYPTTGIAAEGLGGPICTAEILSSGCARVRKAGAGAQPPLQKCRGNRDRSHLQLSQGLCWLQAAERHSGLDIFLPTSPENAWGMRLYRAPEGLVLRILPYSSGWRRLAPEEESSTAAHTINHNYVCTDYSCYGTKV